MRASYLFAVFSIFVHMPSVSAQVTSDDQAITARGVVEAVEHATLSSAISSQIIKMNVRRGERFAKGDTLIEFACVREKAARNGAHARWQAAEQQWEKNKELLSYEAIGKFDVEISKAQMQEAKADYDIQKAATSQCQIKAPYDGAVTQKLMNTYETPQTNQPLIDIVKTSELEVSLIVPSSALSWLNIGDEFPFIVDDTGTTETLHITRIGAVVDPISQTVDVIGTVLTPAPQLRPGMGGEGRIRYRAGG